ncbi:YbaK/EbsC family protein [Streptomyces sp. NBC_00388]|uniref:YbaK/EbsC family protein n=1 Tax=Streptomyces sp. NBC_00388 TaxID=2975735 RepID=UPI002E1BB228
MDLLTSGGAPHRVLAHPPEGRTDAASLLRGHPLRQAAKTIVVRVALGRKKSRYVLAVVPGDRRVDLGAVVGVAGGVRAGFADRATAERLTGCVSGSIVPFSFHPDLAVIADPDLLAEDEIFFNAARLDLSVAMPAPAYRRLAAPLVSPITEPATAAQAA